jgi:hypothetical protein
MKNILFTLLLFLNISCATKITKLDPPENVQKGLFLAINFEGKLAEANCMLSLVSSEGKRYHLSKELLSKQPQLLELPNGIYSFEQIQCSIPGEQFDQKASLKTRYLSNLHMSTEKVTIAQPIKLLIDNQSVSIELDENYTQQFFKEVSRSTHKTSAIYSAYDESLIPPDALRVGSHNDIELQYVRTKDNSDAAQELNQKLLDCKSIELKKRLLLIGKRTLIFDPEKKNDSAFRFIPDTRSQLSNYSQEIDTCMTQTLNQYRSKIRDRWIINY